MYAQLFLSADLSKPNMYLHDLFTFAWLCFSAIDLLVTVAWKLARNEFFPFLFWSCVEFAAADVEFFLRLGMFWLISDAIITFLVSLFISELLLARTFLELKSKYPERTFFAVGYRSLDGKRFVLLGGVREDLFAESEEEKEAEGEADFEVSELRANVVKKESRAMYMRSMSKFLAWLFFNNRHIISPEVSLLADTAANKVSFFKSILQTAPNDPPIIFELLTAPVFMKWIVSLRKKNGDKPGVSSHSSHRSGLFHLFVAYHVTMPQELEKEVSNHFKGLKRKVASVIAAGGGKIKVGKDPLAFSLYRFLGLILLQLDTCDSIFARTFMIIAWNLMARSANTFDICISHMEWQGDALCIYFSQMKNDQMGERPRDPRHIYANPLCPEICGILSLGIFWSCYAFEEGEMRLFPGNNQYDRFRKILARLVVLEQVADELERRAIDPSSLGTHSMRKGASTFCASGSTSCPPSAAIHLRAGWSLQGVQDTYIRYESAGDMYVGRTVSGLPIDSPEFASLPPHFKQGTESQLIKRALGMVFPNMPFHLTAIGEFAMASLVYHHEYLVKNLPPTHPLMNSVLFRTSHLYDELSPFVVCVEKETDAPIRATGIPAHVTILSQLKEMTLSWQENVRAQNENVQKIVEGVTKVLEEKAVGLGTVTYAGLSDAIKKCVEEGGIMRGVEAIENPHAPQPEITNAPQTTALYTWGGKLHLFPESFQFPTGSVLEAWQYWCVGDESRGYPPLKKMAPDDLATKNLRKRLCDYKFLMNKIEVRASELGLSIVSPTEQQALEIYNSCSNAILIPTNTGTGKKLPPPSKVMNE